MKAVVWHGKENVSVDHVNDPKILNPHDAIIKVTSTAICGSDLHLYDGVIPSMRDGDILGHEFMGEIVELGPEVNNLQVGDRVVVPFPIACGVCYFCDHQMHALCDNTNPNAVLAEATYGYSPAGIFGYSHLMGGYAGGQAEFVRVPFANVGPFKVPDHLEDEKVLFLTDIFPTGFMAAEACEIQEGDVIAIWGAGPVGQFAVKSALLLGAHQVIVIDRLADRLSMAKGNDERVTTINYEEIPVLSTLNELTAGRGPDACIDAVGMEAHGTGMMAAYDELKFGLKLETDKPIALREAIQACRKGGVVSIPGVYGGVIDKVPIGAIFNKGLKLKTGQTHVHRYLQSLLDYIENGDIDPSFIISHRLILDEAPYAYEIFKHKYDECRKVILKPQ
ncbi:MAG: zinc-dependent alcohol dehydrogenase [Oligoflexus sp.]